MVAIEELELQVVPLAYPGLQVAGRLNEVSLGVVVEHLKLLDDLLLVFDDFVLLVDLCLEAADFDLLFVGLQFNQAVQVCHVALPHAHFMLLRVDHRANAVYLTVQVLLRMLVGRQR